MSVPNKMLHSLRVAPRNGFLDSCLRCIQKRYNTTSSFSKTGSAVDRRSGRNVEHSRRPVFHHFIFDSGNVKRHYGDLATEGEARSINPAASVQSKIFFFDTYALVDKLKSKGFTDEQAIGIMEGFQEVLQNSIEHQIKSMVTKSQQEITVQQLMAHIASVKKDMVILEKSEFSMLRNETEKQSMEIEQLNKNLQNELSKLRGNITLDINLERSRATEAHALNQKELQMLHNKVDTEIANLRTVYEKYRNDVFKYASGLALTAGAMTVGLLRLLF